MTTLYAAALGDLARVLDRVDDAEVQRAIEMIVGAHRIALYGVGREGLQIRGLAMRLVHLGLATSVVGDMSCPPLGAGDVLIASAGPGYFSTVAALLGVARRDGAASLVVTAQPQGECAAAADAVLHLPAQTMADDQAAAASVLPMGSLYEGALYVLFETIVLRLRDRLAVDPAAMRARHTNLE